MHETSTDDWCTFAGAMRSNLFTMLDEIGVHTALGITRRSTRARTTPGPPRSRASRSLAAFARQVLAANLRAVPDALVIPSARKRPAPFDSPGPNRDGSSKDFRTRPKPAARVSGTTRPTGTRWPEPCGIGSAGSGDGIAVYRREDESSGWVAYTCHNGGLDPDQRHIVDRDLRLVWAAIHPDRPYPPPDEE